MKAYIDIKYSTLQTQRNFFSENLREILRPYFIVNPPKGKNDDFLVKYYVYNKKDDALNIYNDRNEYITDLQLQKEFFLNLREILRPYFIVNPPKGKTDEFVEKNYLYPPNPYGLVKTLKDTTEQASELVEKLSAEQQSRETNEQLTKLLTDTQNTAIDLVKKLQNHRNIKDKSASFVNEIFTTIQTTKPQLTGLLESAGKEANAVVEKLIEDANEKKKKKKIEDDTNNVTGLLDSAGKEANTVVEKLMEEDEKKKKIEDDTNNVTGLLDSAETEANTVINTLVKDDALKKSEQLGNQLIQKLKTDEDKQRSQAIVDEFKKSIKSEKENVVSSLEKAQTVEDVDTVAEKLKNAVQKEFENKSNKVGAKHCHGKLGGCTEQLSDIAQEYKEKVDEEALIIKVGRLEDDIKNTKDKKATTDQLKQLEQFKEDTENILSTHTLTDKDEKYFTDFVVYIADIIEANKTDESDVAEPKPEDTLEILTKEVSKFVKENPPETTTINTDVCSTAEELRKRIRQLEKNPGISKEQIQQLLVLLDAYNTNGCRRIEQQKKILKNAAANKIPKSITYDDLTTQIQNIVSTGNDNDPSEEDCKKVEQLKTFLSKKKIPDKQKKEAETAMKRLELYINKCEDKARKLKVEELLQNKQSREEQELIKEAAEAAAKAAAEEQQFIQTINDILETKPEDIDKPVDALANLTQHINNEQKVIDALVSENKDMLGQLTVLLEEANEKQSSGSKEEQEKISKQILELKAKITTKKNSITKLQTELEKNKQKKKEIGNSLLIVNVGKSIKKIHDSIMTMTRFIDGFKDSKDQKPPRSVLLNKRSLEGHLNKIDPNFLKRFDNDDKIKSQWKGIVDTVLNGLNKTEKKDNLILDAKNDTENIKTLREWYNSIEKEKDRLEKEKNAKKKVMIKKTKTLTSLLEKTTATATQIIQELNIKEKKRLDQEKERLKEEKERLKKQEEEEKKLARKEQREQLEKQIEEDKQRAEKNEEIRKQQITGPFEKIMEPFDFIQLLVEEIEESKPLNDEIGTIIAFADYYHLKKKVIGRGVPDEEPRWYKVLQTYAERFTNQHTIDHIFNNDEHKKVIVTEFKEEYSDIFGENDFFDNNDMINKKILSQYLLDKINMIEDKIKKLTFFVIERSTVSGGYFSIKDFHPNSSTFSIELSFYLSNLNLKILYRCLCINIIYYFGCRMLSYYINDLKTKNVDTVMRDKRDKIYHLVQHLTELKENFKNSVLGFSSNISDLLIFDNGKPDTKKAGSTADFYKIITIFNQIIDIKENNYKDIYGEVKAHSFDSIMELDN